MNQKSSKNRTHMRILGDVLEVIIDGGRDGVLVSYVSRRAKLSHNPTLEHCKKLISAGLVESKIEQRNHVFTITEKGFHFIHEYRKFRDLVESFNLRY